MFIKLRTIKELFNLCKIVDQKEKSIVEGATGPAFCVKLGGLGLLHKLQHGTTLQKTGLYGAPL